MKMTRMENRNPSFRRKPESRTAIAGEQTPLMDSGLRRNDGDRTGDAE
jgi:hypothetical protein